RRLPSSHRHTPRSSHCATPATNRSPKLQPYWTVTKVPRGYAFIGPKHSCVATCVPASANLNSAPETCRMRDPTNPTNTEDDVDRLFARLDRVPVPEDLTERVLASTVARSEATRAVLAWPWMLAGLAALGLLTLTGYQLGASLAMSDGLEVVAAIVEYFCLMTTA